MASVEIITRLSPSICKYNAPSTPSFSGLSRIELAALLVGLSSEAMNFALAKYTGDESAYWRLVSQMRVWASGLAARKDWKIVRGRPTVYNMVALATAEAVETNRCRTCKGRGIEGAKLCRTCSGNTFVRFSNAMIARNIGVSETAYSRIWKSCYEFCYRHVQDYDTEISKCLRDYNKNEITLDRAVDSQALFPIIQSNRA